jgi:hypothetical protein
MKNALIVVLAVATMFLADRMVRIENQRYALYGNLCRPDPANRKPVWECLEKAQTRTSWVWHFLYAVSDRVPAVPLFAH